MNLVISSKKIDNPLLVELLRKLTDIFDNMGQCYYVIGATARDIIIQQLTGGRARRKTRDLDIAIAIPNWEIFEQVSEQLMTSGFNKSRHMHQRFYYGEYELDVVPFGDIAKEDDSIYWPPEETIAMSVKGFDNVLSNAVTISIDNEFDIKIASLHGLFILKLEAWRDRNMKTGKDAADMSFILAQYHSANLSCNVHSEIYEWDDFEEYVAGAYWLAWDLLSILTIENIEYYKNFIDSEIQKEEDSKLINDILEQDTDTVGLKYETVKRALQKIVDVFHARLVE